jgi:hypothetical protein
MPLVSSARAGVELQARKDVPSSTKVIVLTAADHAVELQDRACGKLAGTIRDPAGPRLPASGYAISLFAGPDAAGRDRTASLVMTGQRRSSLYRPGHRAATSRPAPRQVLARRP